MCYNCVKQNLRERLRFMIRFIHAADLHLDRPFEGLSQLPEPLRERVRASTFAAFDRLIDRTLTERADFLIIAGDLFDGSHRSLKAQKRFIDGMRRLGQAGIPAVLAFGNHDHLDDPWNRLTMPGNVRVFATEPTMIPLEVNGQLIHFYGFSYGTRHISEDMVSRYAKKEGAAVHIGVLHGAQGDEKRGLYAPFNIRELAEKGFDYWALGHIHKRHPLPPPLSGGYPGNTQGLSVAETGDKGALIVELGGGDARVRFFSTADILWQRKSIPCTGPLTADRLVALLEEAVDGARSDRHGVFLMIDLVLSDAGKSHDEIADMLDELVPAMRDGEPERADFVWLMDPEVTFKQDWDRGRLLKSGHFVGDLLRLIEQDRFLKEALEPLYEHQRAGRYLSFPDDRERRRIRDEAEQILVEALLTERTHP